MTYIQPQNKSLTAFWENTAESKHREIQVLFQYGLVPWIIRSTLVNLWTTTALNSNAIVSSWATWLSSAILETEGILTYKAGQWWLVMFSAWFTGTPATGNERAIWFWEKDVDWFYVWYNWTSFWILHINNTVKTWIPQASRNGDNADWTGKLPAINTATWNVFMIKGQHLWYGEISFYMANRDAVLSWWDKFERIHTIQYANTSTVPSQRNPSNPIIAYSDNTTNTTDLSVFTASMSWFIEWDDTDAWQRHTIGVLSTWATTNKNIVTVRGKATFGGIVNKVLAKPLFISASCDWVKATSFTVIINGVFTGTPVWVDVDTPSSTLEYDTAWVYTAWTWEPVFWFDLSKVWNDKFFLKDCSIELRPQDSISIIANSASNTDISASIVMNEEF